MILLIEGVVLCALFTVMVYIMSRKPIKTLYNYPPKIQERVMSLDEYKDQIPTQENKLAAKVGASLLFVVILALILRFINGYTSFWQAFGYGFLLWTIVNAYDAIVLDIIWFCHDPQFVFRGTEDMVDEYHNYWFHIKGFFIGEVLALVVCALAGALVWMTAGVSKEPYVDVPEVVEMQEAVADNEEKDDVDMILQIDGKEIPVTWEDNSSVDALRELATDGLEIQMSMYGGFEQVGSIGQSIVRDDKQTTTSAGDIMLYSGNQIVVFYGSNSWAYTRLGKIDLSQEKLTELLANGDVVLKLGN